MPERHFWTGYYTNIASFIGKTVLSRPQKNLNQCSANNFTKTVVYSNTVPTTSKPVIEDFTFKAC